MKVYVDAWIYVTEKFVNVGNIELYEEISRYEKADYPPIPSFIKEILLLIFNKVLYHSTAQSASTILRRNAAPCKPLEERTVGDSSGDCSARQMEADENMPLDL